MTALELYAARHNLTKYFIAQAANLPYSTVKSAFKKTLSQTTVRTLNAIAKANKCDVQDVLEELTDLEMVVAKQQAKMLLNATIQEILDLGFTIKD